MIEILDAPGSSTPWWAALLAIAVSGVFLFFLRVLRLLVPDKSSDRLAWWIAILEHRRGNGRRGNATATQRRRASPENAAPKQGEHHSEP
ncbi:hypothetical protein [Streptomyces clavuligerus]|uniref:Uncharacterized protein n=1 Tax=Streptomyces clavuligerus TaxID=1901 RepID=B5GV30_STRCL|nr:hypothetical protein [Streptomyces clavuligerus]AXU15143.1 hypothetical protein D1794_21900 [Streptomyces clavuligerus]EDY50176.1 hypothetical protein SSCG_03165 [Streptomyces clavuligerus]EFG06498.1 Hypothetical protein SCLAV_1419 [Streptomyces clavuligerus]MBY6305208.1 hypothetical protein [Streptomyces clavuligerus]QCS07918.1 hypothetical protein CRV15_21265 [Streptomyces clavuligerus]